MKEFIMLCVACLISNVEPVPEAVTQISGTLVCRDCALAVSQMPNARRDTVIGAQRRNQFLRK